MASVFRQIREDIHAIFDRDPAARNVFEIITTYPGVHAVLFHRISHGLWRRNFKWLARLFSNLARWYTGIEIHPGARIGERFFIDHGMGVVIGETAEIGNDCTLYHGVTLGGTSWSKGKRHPTLEDNVVIGAGAKVLGPITISAGARVGSNAVVTKDVPADSTVVGVPGRVITRKKDDVEHRRVKTAQKMGFDAYGVAQDAPDPVAKAINCMLDHIHMMDEKMERMCKALKALDAEMDDMQVPKLGELELDTDDGESGASSTEKNDSCSTDKLDES